MDDAVRDHLEAIDPAQRLLFDRVHRLVDEVAPEATLGISYDLPTFALGKRKLHVGVWRHGLSFYGWRAGGDGGFAERHPDLLHGKGTIRLRPADAEAVTDDELRALIRSTLLA